MLSLLVHNVRAKKEANITDNSYFKSSSRYPKQSVRLVSCRHLKIPSITFFAPLLLILLFLKVHCEQVSKKISGQHLLTHDSKILSLLMIECETHELLALRDSNTYFFPIKYFDVVKAVDESNSFKIIVNKS